MQDKLHTDCNLGKVYNIHVLIFCMWQCLFFLFQFLIWVIFLLYSFSYCILYYWWGKERYSEGTSSCFLNNLKNGLRGWGEHPYQSQGQRHSFSHTWGGNLTDVGKTFYCSHTYIFWEILSSYAIQHKLYYTYDYITWYHIYLYLHIHNWPFQI
jgi:hypothetical protein